MIPMQFKQDVWPVNPREITLRYERTVKELLLPMKGSRVQDLGRKRRVVTGKGTFSGERAMEDFRKLASVFQEEGSGVLWVPGFPSFSAVFSQLKLLSYGREGEVPYECTFLEEEDLPAPKTPDFYLCKGGESLWEVAAKTGTVLEELVELNRLRQIQQLSAGERIFLRKAEEYAV